MKQSVGQDFIDLLREDGWLVKVEHLRLDPRGAARLETMYGHGRPDVQYLMSELDRLARPKHLLRDAGHPIHNRGGVTRITVNREGEPGSLAGAAYCSPLDNFHRRMGLIKASGRLRALLQETGRI